jgi:hypothetical protein
MQKAGSEMNSVISDCLKFSGFVCRKYMVKFVSLLWTHSWQALLSAGNDLKLRCVRQSVFKQYKPVLPRKETKLLDDKSLKRRL